MPAKMGLLSGSRLLEAVYLVPSRKEGSIVVLLFFGGCCFCSWGRIRIFSDYGIYIFRRGLTPGGFLCG